MRTGRLIRCEPLDAGARGPDGVQGSEGERGIVAKSGAVRANRRA